MFFHKKRVGLLLTVSMMLLVALSACGGGTLGSAGSPTPTKVSTPTPTPTPTIDDLFTKSKNTMSHLKTVHYEIDLSEVINIKSTDGQKQQQSISMNGKGDEILPDQTSVKFDETMGSQSISLDGIMKGKQVYLRKEQGTWYVLSQKAGNPFSGVTASDPASQLSQFTDSAQKVDQGTEQIDGVKLRHITYTLGQDAIEKQLKSAGLLDNLGTQKDVDQVLKSIKVKDYTMDLWADAQTGYIHRIKSKMDVSLDLKALSASSSNANGSSASGTMDMGVESIINYSKFDAPVTITVPTNATPVDSLQQVLQ